MSTQDRVVSLKARHEAIEGRLKAEQCRPHPDLGTIHELKREKLRIKDEIANLV